jgi:hypothetical protein
MRDTILLPVIHGGGRDVTCTERSPFLPLCLIKFKSCKELNLQFVRFKVDWLFFLPTAIDFPVFWPPFHTPPTAPSVFSLGLDKASEVDCVCASSSIFYV